MLDAPSSQVSGIVAVTREVLTLIDATEGSRSDYFLEPGSHELERIPSPLGHDCDWLVLKGTKIGWAENYWRSLRRTANPTVHPSSAMSSRPNEGMVVIKEH